MFGSWDSMARYCPENIWDFIDYSAQFLVVLSGIIALILLPLGKSQNPYLAVLFAITTFLLLAKAHHVVRGFDELAWIVAVLERNFIDMRYFLVVLLVSIFFYSMSFTALYIGTTVNEDDVDDDLAAHLVTSESSNAIWMPFFMIFNMGVLGDFSSGAFEHSVNKFVTIFFFLVFVIHTTVRAMTRFVITGESLIGYRGVFGRSYFSTASSHYSATRLSKSRSGKWPR